MAFQRQILLLVCGVVAVTHGLLDVGGCDIEVWPESSEPKVKFRLVPGGCDEGVFSWAYPKESVHLEFPNPGPTNMTVCVTNLLLGNIFTIRDITHGLGMPMIIGEKESCALWHSTAIILRIDAPKHQLYYTAAIKYHVRVL